MVYLRENLQLLEYHLVNSMIEHFLKSHYCMLVEGEYSS